MELRSQTWLRLGVRCAAAIGFLVALPGAGCDYALGVRPANYVLGQRAVATGGALEARTEGLYARPNATEVATLVELRNLGPAAMGIERIDLVTHDGTAIHARVDRASATETTTRRAASGPEALPLTLAPGAGATVAAHWTLPEPLESACRDHCTLVLAHRDGETPTELRIELLDHPPSAAPGAR